MLREQDGNTLIAVRVTPRAGKNAVTGRRGEFLTVAVRAAPTDGQANSAVIETLSAALGLPKSRIELTHGHKSREKTVRVDGLTPDKILEQLKNALE